MSKKFKQSHRGITWQPNWDWEREHRPVLELKEREPYVPASQSIPGYWRLQEDARKAHQEMARTAEMLAGRVVSGWEIDEDLKQQYRDARAAYARALGISDQVYDAYTDYSDGKTDCGTVESEAG